jgi:Fe-Mn family superoxide dismutase
MELHHSKHHQTYVTSYNNATEQFQAAEAKQDIAAKVALQPLINFHGGGHLNHTLFWENLAPKSQGGGGEPSGALKVCSLRPMADPSLLRLQDLLHMSIAIANRL